MSATGVPLLAKSPTKDGRRLSLAAHCSDTEDAAAAIFRIDGRWARAWSRFFGLDEPEQFLLNLRVAALFHDIGKANEEFQARMSRQGRTQGPQTLRHEHVSALVLSLQDVRAWLEANPALDADVITAAVLSHHIKASDQGEFFRWCQPRSDRRLQLHLDHPEILAIFERVREVGRLGPVPALPKQSWSATGPWAEALTRGQRNAVSLGRSVRNDDRRHGLLMAVKAGVIVADSVASGLFRVGGPMTRWIDEIVHMGELSGQDIADKIIAPRTRQISRRSNEPFIFIGSRSSLPNRGAVRCCSQAADVARPWRPGNGPRTKHVRSRSAA